MNARGSGGAKPIHHRVRKSLFHTTTSALVLAATVQMTVVTPALAMLMGEGNDMFAGLKVVSDQTLAAHRGKFMAPNGLDLSFGAQVTTLVNGTMALVTNITTTAQGIVSSQTGPAANGGHFTTPNGQTVTGISAPAGPQLQTAINTVVQNTTGPGNSGNTNNSGPLNLSGAPGGQGVVVTGGNPANGITAAVTDIAPTHILNVIANTADNRSVTQQVQLQVTINNFSAFRQQLAQGAVVSHILSSVQAGVIRGMAH